MSLLFFNIVVLQQRQVMVANENADISPDNLVVRFSESVDGFPLPKGHSQNPELAAEQKPQGEAYLKDREQS